MIKDEYGILSENENLIAPIATSALIHVKKESSSVKKEEDLKRFKEKGPWVIASASKPQPDERWKHSLKKKKIRRVRQDKWNR